jgi:hypothetical protein
MQGVSEMQKATVPMVTALIMKLPHAYAFDLAKASRDEVPAWTAAARICLAFEDGSGAKA